MGTDLLDGLHKREMGDRGFFKPMDTRIHGWVMERAREGEQVNRSDPSFPKMDENMRYIMGNQLTGVRPAYVPRVVVNETKRTCRIHASALTDIKPLFAWRVGNPKFSDASAALNQLLIIWWVSRFTDLRLADVIKYALACGAGDGVLEWDASLDGIGDNVLYARDPRDTLPINPAHSARPQDWGGVVLRQTVDPTKLAAKYPDRELAIGAAMKGSNKFGGIFTRFLRTIVQAKGTLDGLSSAYTGPQLPAAGVTTYAAYFKDESVNKYGKIITVGPPGSNFAYDVMPGEKLYPRGRLAYCLENCTLYDGPNPYWHGLFPVSRYSPDPWPWSFFGLAPTSDMRPLQDGINSGVNWLLMNLGQHVERGQIWDSKASDAVVKRLDVREPNYKVRFNMQLGKLFELADVAQVPAWGPEFVRYLSEKFAELGETSNFQQLLQLRQVPSGDTLERYQNALTPGIRMEGRYLEYFLRDMAVMLLSNVFQFYSAARRYSMIGEAGQTLADVDWDPDTMIPAMKPGDEGYTPELDAKIDRHERAQFFKNLFTFYVAPNSLLAMNAQEQKVLYLQLYRMGLVDRWTLMDKLEIPNAGTPPAVMLPGEGAPTPQPVIDPETGLPAVDPATGQPQVNMVPPMEYRVPVTITEKLLAEMQLGIGAQPSAAGRPPSGQAMPAVEQKSDGRTTITESK